MPLIIPLDPIPVQELNYTYGDVRFTLTVRQLDDSIVTFSTIRNGEEISNSARAASAVSLIPFDYLDEGLGNFYFETANDELPHYSKFGISQFLLFVTPEELSDVRS